MWHQTWCYHVLPSRLMQKRNNMWKTLLMFLSSVQSGPTSHKVKAMLAWYPQSVQIPTRRCEGSFSCCSPCSPTTNQSYLVVYSKKDLSCSVILKPVIDISILLSPLLSIPTWICMILHLRGLSKKIYSLGILEFQPDTLKRA